MARTDGKAERQHYVPKMLLRHFAFEGRGKQPQIHVFDKRTDAEFSTGIGNVAAERGFYNFPESDASLEPLLSDLEEKTAAALQKLHRARRFDVLSGQEASWVATFVAVQFLRASNFREVAREMDESLKTRVIEMGGDPDHIGGWRPFKSEGDIKIFAMVSVAKLAPELSQSLLAKSWVLFETQPDKPFWLSDNPVALHNDREFGPYGNIGFMVPGVQVYLPVSPTLMLALWCQSHEATFRNAARDGRALLDKIFDGVRKASGYQPTLDEVFLREIERRQLAQLEGFLANIDAGRPTPCTEREVMFFNSLQVYYADRYVLSSTAKFDLAKRMIADNPARRKGWRLKF